MGDLDDAVRQFARANASRRGGSGIPAPPSIEVNETVFDPQHFVLDLTVDGKSKSAPGSGGGGGGGPPPFVCPPTNPCTLDFTVSTTHWAGTTQTGLNVADGTCQSPTQPTGWRSNNWASDCFDAICGTSNSGCNDLDEACLCGAFGRWRDATTGAMVQIKLDYIQGDDVVTPDGWWLLVGVSDPTGVGGCFYGGCNASGAPYGYYLGADESVFATDLTLNLTLPGRFGCTGDSATFDITFHPC